MSPHYQPAEFAMDMYPTLFFASKNFKQNSAKESLISKIAGQNVRNQGTNVILRDL